jgi:cyclophilin family peptidyl-prolyl cis-trans isomerase
MQVKKLKRSRAGSLIQTARAIGPTIERLENRQLFAAAVGATQGPVLAHPATPATDSIDLSNDFNDSTLTTPGGTIVEFRTTVGNVDVQLTDSATPLTVANFLSYVSSGAYSNTFFHRSVVLSTNAGGTPAAPSDIVQGGGYSLVNNAAQHISTAPPIADEYTKNLQGDIVGTLAMAKTSEADSASSEFFFNVHDNSSALDTPTTDSNGVMTAYTVFGTVLGNGMNVVGTIAALPTSSVGSSLTTVPVVNVSPANVAKASIFPNNLVYIQSVSVIPNFTYSAVSDNPQLVNPVVKGSSLSFQYAPGQTGTADITVTATAADGTSSTQTFGITVPNTTTPAASIVANPDSQTIAGGTTTILNPLANDTDSLAAIDPSTIAIFSQPAHGVASVNTATGTISYTPTAGYTGPDTVLYTVGDTANNTSTATTISLDVATQVTIGTGGHHELDYTQPNGAVGRLTVTDGTAIVTFSSSQVTVVNNTNSVSATGTGATISNITITDDAGKQAILNMSGSGVATIGSISSTGSLNAIIAPHAQLTGALSVGGLGELVLASTNAALLTIGQGVPLTTLLINAATDTSVAATSALTIRSKQWLNSDGLDDTITAASINQLTVAGEFADGLVLTGPAGLQKTTIGGNITGGAWTIDGPVTTLIAKSAAATWSLTSTDAITSLTFRGDLAGSISATTIGTLTVAGAMHDNSITSSAAIANGWQIGKVTVHGAITNSSIIANGSIGFVRSASLSGSQIYSGVTSTDTISKILPSLLANFAQPSAITAVEVSGTFSNSLIAAPLVKTLHVGAIQTNNNDSTEGVAAQTINSLTGALSSGGRLLLGRAQLKTATTLSSFLTNHRITLADFAIDILES